MASKKLLIVLACCLGLLINTNVFATSQVARVSSANEEEILAESSPNLIAFATPPPPTPPKSVSPPTVKAPPPSPSPPPPAPSQPRNTKECFPPCVVRCKNHSRKNVCLRACVTCCDRCKCVPPGQYGNTEMCGKCYSTMTTRGGKLKCP